MSHTPGKWKFIDSHDGRMKGFIRLEDASTGVLSIAQVTTSRREWEDNARLIAAAPDLLQALKLVFDRQYAQKTEDAVQLTLEVFGAITAAIRKAEGK